MDNGYIKQEILKPGLAEITFYHPSHNSLPSNLLTDLVETINKAGQNPDIQVIILNLLAKELSEQVQVSLN